MSMIKTAPSALLARMLCCFDNASLYEHSILTIVSMGLAILLTPAYRQDIPREALPYRPILVWAVVLLCSLVLLLQLVNIITWREMDMFHSHVSFSASLFSFIGTFGVSFVFNSSYAFSFPPVAFPSLFLAFTLPYEIAMARVCLNKGGVGTIFALQLAIAGLKSTLVILGYASRNRFFSEQASASSYQYLIPWSSFTSVPGLRTNFNVADLPNLLWDRGSELLYEQFRSHFGQVDRNSDLALAKAAFLTLRPYLYRSGLFRLCHTVLTLAQPFLLKRLIQTTFLGEFSLLTLTLNSFATAIVFVVLSIFKFSYETVENRMSTAARTFFIAAVYDKSTRLNSDNIDRKVLGSGLFQFLAEVEDLLRSAQESLWAAVNVVLGLCLLFPLAGTASILLTVPIIFVAIASAANASREADWQRVYDERRGTRSQITSRLLAQIKTLKSVGLAPVMAEYLQQQKSSEMEALLRVQYSRLSVFSLAAFIHGMTPAFVLGGLVFWASSPEMLLTANVFACIAMVAIIVNAAGQAIEKMAHGNTGIFSLTRIQAYLTKTEVNNWRHDNVLGSASCPLIVESLTLGLQISGLYITASTGREILQNVSMHLASGCFAVVFGPPGCGKSTLVRAILGELQPTDGTIVVANPHVIYCGQEVWLQNLSIQANVIGYVQYLPAWYMKVMQACMLSADLDRMPGQDGAIAGSNGCNFDISLRQRIGLARAIYGCPPILVLDSILSAVHPDMASKILVNLIGPDGILNRWHCTVVMTTSNDEFLQHADTLYEMTAEGRLQRYTDVQQYIRRRNASSLWYEKPTYRNMDLSETSESLGLQLESCTFPEKDGHENQTCNVAIYAYLLQPAGRYLIALFLLAAVAAATMKKMPDIALQISLHHTNLDRESVAQFVRLAIGSIICTGVSAFIYFKHINKTCSEAFYERLVHTVLNATPSFLRNADLGSLLRLFTEDFPRISRDLPIAFMQLCYTTITCLLNIWILSTTAKYAWILIFPYIAILYHAKEIYLPFSQQLRLVDRQSVAAVSAHCVATTEGIEYIRVFRFQVPSLQALYRILNNAQKSYYHKLQAHSRLVLILNLFAAVSGIFLVVLAHVFPASSSPTRLSLALVTLLRFSDETTFLFDILTRLDECLSSASRIQSCCCDTPLENAVTSDLVGLEFWPSLGLIAFDDATTERSDDEEELITAHNLDGVTFSIQPGLKASICAKFGHGESAIVQTLLGMEDYQGSISIDRREIRCIPPDVLRTRITTITQDGFELPGSVRLNLDPLSICKPYFTDMDFLNMLERVGLWQTICERGGLDTDISKMRFTPVEKQLLDLARGALHRRRVCTNIVLIDKATSNLEGQQELKMQDFMDGEFACCTVITIADRMTTSTTADMCLVLEAGMLKNILNVRYTHFN